jgi:hypothetical protein
MAAGLVGGGEGRFDTGLQVDGSDGGANWLDLGLAGGRA